MMKFQCSDTSWEKKQFPDPEIEPTSWKSISSYIFAFLWKTSLFYIFAFLCEKNLVIFMREASCEQASEFDAFVLTTFGRNWDRTFLRSFEALLKLSWSSLGAPLALF
jgi:hypothetical protein